MPKASNSTMEAAMVAALDQLTDNTSPTGILNMMPVGGMVYWV